MLMYPDISVKTRLYGYIYKNRFDRLLSNLDCLVILLGGNDAFLIQNTPPFMSLVNFVNMKYS